MPSDEERPASKGKDKAVEDLVNESGEPTSHSAEDTHDSEEEPQLTQEAQDQDVPDNKVDQAQWQAVYSPQFNAYYFYNPVTQETTWNNPLVPDASTSTAHESVSVPESTAGSTTEEKPDSSTPALPHYAALQAAAIAQNIDPELAHLDPSLLAPSVPGSAKGPGDLPTFTAQFNARTGAFAPANSRTPGHLSETERAKRMSEFYFDVNQWEKDLAAHGGSIKGETEDEANGRKRKRPSKKDLERFKEQKRLKKIAKTAWLRT